MEKLFFRIRKTIKKYRAKKFNKFVKQHYRINKNKNIEFSKNIWNKNFYWDFYFQSFPHSIKSTDYVPYDYYNYMILPNLNDPSTKIYVQDKNMFDRIFANAGVKLPNTIFRCMNNIFMDAKYSKIEAIDEFVANIKQDVIVKRTKGSGAGSGVEKYIYSEGKLINYKTKEDFDLNRLIKVNKGDFIVQEVVQQHSELAKYHPHSLNTVKVLTYRSVITNEVSILIGYFRIGVNKAFLDNMGTGGLAIGIEINDKNEAFLLENALDKYAKEYIKNHPTTGIQFKDNEIPNFHLIFDSVKKLSNFVPYQRLIGWDFSIDAQGNPVLIESNFGSDVGDLQVTNGKPLFGNFTQEVKEYLDKL